MRFISFRGARSSRGDSSRSGRKGQSPEGYLILSIIRYWMASAGMRQKSVTSFGPILALAKTLLEKLWVNF